ncbi:MAG: hypothetical protein FWC81_04100 [Coriobacteriia bacterium]|nr:hypothetical protein [Coriobacteriia bacterium]
MTKIQVTINVDTSKTMGDAVRQLRNYFAQNLSAVDAITSPSFLPQWQTERNYTAGELLRYEGEVYRVLQAHRSQADWRPANVPALFTALDAEKENRP